MSEIDERLVRVARAIGCFDTDGCTIMTPLPGQVWRPTKPGSGRRMITAQVVDPDPEKVSYKTPSGVYRRITLTQWREWVDRWGCHCND